VQSSLLPFKKQNHWYSERVPLLCTWAMVLLLRMTRPDSLNFVQSNSAVANSEDPDPRIRMIKI
jgi:hypothetical protein